MFDPSFTRKLKNLSIFVVVYTVIFLLFFKTISYTLPFVLAMLIALCTKPLMNFFKNKWKLSSTISSLISTIFVFLILLFLLSAVVYKITSESKQLLLSIPPLDIIQENVQKYLNELKIYYARIDPSIIQKLQSQVTGLLSSTFNITAAVLNKLVSFAIGLPMFFLIVFITLLATYFFTKDMPNMEHKFISIFSGKSQPKVRTIWSESNRMFSGYIKAYFFIVTVTFLETLVGFWFLKVKYTVILSFLCWIFDLLPILGIGTVYFPLIVIYFIAGNYFTAIGLVVLYVLITTIRQIIEPKIVSSSLGLHPIAVLAAIFIGLKSFGFLGMIYLVFIMIFYKVLNKVGII